MFLGFLCLSSYRLFENMAREHGAAGLQGRAALFSSMYVGSFLLLALGGSGVWAARQDDDSEWLSSLPAPAWVLHTAKIGEAALWNPVGWSLIVPFFTGLCFHAGLGLLAPVIGLAISLPLFLVYAVLVSVIDLVSKAWSRSRVFRVVRIVAPWFATSFVVVWMIASSLSKQSRPGPLDVFAFNPFGSWLDFSSGLAWLPFSEPARGLLALRQTPLQGLAWLGAFAVQLAALLGFGLLALRRTYHTELVHGRAARRGATLPRANAARQRRLGGRLGAVIGKELLWFRRNPSRSVGFIVSVLLCNGVGVLLLSQLPQLDGRSAPGLVLLVTGTFLLFRIGGTLLELEQPALWHLATLPRSIARVFAQKTLLVVALSTVGALPAALHALRLAPSARAAAPGLVYGALCIATLALLQTGLWLRRVDPSAATSPLRHVWRSLQVSLVAVILGNGLSSSSTLASLVPLLVFVAVFAVAYWHTTMARFPFVLDQSAQRPAALTATYAVVVLFLLRFVQSMVLGWASLAQMTPVGATSLSIIVASAMVVPVSVFWLWFDNGGVPQLAQRLGLGRGKGLLVIVREGLAWGTLAAFVNQVYWGLLGPRVSQSSELTPEQTPAMVSLASSATAMVAIGVVIVPVVEELLYRGMLHRSLRSTWAIVPSLLVSAALFTIDHTLLAAVPIFFGAACMTLALERSRSLFAALLAHAFYNGVIVVQQLAR